MERMGAALVLEEGICIAVNGDDSIFTLGSHAPAGYEKVYYGADLSKCDHTLSKGALELFCSRLYQEHGMTQIEADYMASCRSLGYKAEFRDGKNRVLKITGQAGTQQCTGASDTTVSNSLASGSSLLDVVIDIVGTGGDPAIEIPKRLLAKYGLILKVEDRVLDPCQVVFLRGAFMGLRDGIFGWFPTPGQVILKCGKVLRDVCDIANGTTSKRKQRDYRASFATVCRSVAAGLRVPENMALAGAWVRMLRRLGASGAVVQANTVIESYDFKMPPGQVDESMMGRFRDASVEWCMERYSFEYTDIIELEELIDAVQGPCILHDDRFFNLRVDY
jgi:hypothetical protein